LNNEIEVNEEYKKRIKGLEVMVLIGFEKDSVVRPW